MATYASPRLTRHALQALITLIFLAGCYMLAISVLETINEVSLNYRTHKLVDHNNQTHSEKLPNDNVTVNLINPVLNRFPSVSSTSVKLILSLITFGHGIFGIVAVTEEKATLLTTYSHMLLISCFIKLLFILASVLMHSTSSSQSFMSIVVVLCLLTSTTELTLVMCVCQFSKLVKRGDAARQEIQSIHSYHLERRSRSRSQSRMRSVYCSPYASFSPTPVLGMSRAGSIQDLEMLTSTGENYSYYVPPPIYLKLDQ